MDLKGIFRFLKSNRKDPESDYGKALERILELEIKRADELLKRVEELLREE